MEDLIARFSYGAVFLGSFLEGETVLLLAGLAVQYGFLSFAGVVAAGAAGAFLGDQLIFFIGRRYGDRLIGRIPALAARAPRVRTLLRRWDAATVIPLRFIYGLRIAGPIVIGSCGIPAWRLALFNLIGALLWAPLVAGLGYAAGEAVERWIGRVPYVGIGLAMAVVLAVTVAWLVIQSRRR